MMQATGGIERLLRFAREKGILEAADVRFARNALLSAMKMDAPAPADVPADWAPPPTATPILEELCAAAVARGIIEEDAFSRDQFGAHLMNLLTPPPSVVSARFASLCAERGVEAATDWYYAFSRATDYIRVDQIARNVAFSAPSPYGELDITINLSKPEKDPREIARQRAMPQVGYPSCQLCLENEGYAGRPGYPSHETLRTLPLTLGGEAWRLQYSPYCYYPEHCIALNERHVPMSISRRTFDLLLDFVGQFPHYMLGSNADLPIVGGSILSHDHFQGGRYTFPMDRAQPWTRLAHPDFAAVHAEAVRWPMSCLRLRSASREALVAAADALLSAWRIYSDPQADILSESGEGRHNTITPIARRLAGEYQLQIILRNNRTTPEHPLGLFHPHEDLHHIKKENIGLIEAMGMFILPGRLRAELTGLRAYLTGARRLDRPQENDMLHKHYDWVETLAAAHGTGLPEDEAERVLREAVAAKCVRVLEDAGVFKATPQGDAALLRFLAVAGFRPVRA